MREREAGGLWLLAGLVSRVDGSLFVLGAGLVELERFLFPELILIPHCIDPPHIS